jgi:hypothetical protein
MDLQIGARTGKKKILALPYPHYGLEELRDSS